jgi:hypothetical protein
MGYLKLQVDSDEDGFGELFASFEANGFAGHGSAWFGLNSLQEMAKQLEQYPLPSTPEVYIAGGYWTNDEPATLKEEHLFIAVYPTNSRGGIGVQVRVAHEELMGDGRETFFTASAELRTSYEQMKKFSKALVALARGEVTEFVLDENDV